MVKIQIKPLSANQAWNGRRFKSKLYLSYEKELMLRLPPMKIPPPPYEFRGEYGFSNKASDLDNPTKQLVDVLCKKYNFNDKDIYKITLVKKIVKKGQDYIAFQLLPFQD